MDQLIFASLSHTHYWYEVGMLKVPANTIRKERTYDVLSNIRRESGNGIKILEKSDMSKKTKHVWLSGRLYIEGRLNEGPSLQRKHNKDEKRSKAKQNNFTRCGK